MVKRFLLVRFIRYYKAQGLIKMLKRIPEKVRQTVFRKRDILYYVDLTRLTDGKCKLPEKFSIECKKSAGEMGEEDIKALVRHRGETVIKQQIEERFGEGAVLWLVKVDGESAGFIWSLKANTIQPHYFFLTCNDVHLFDNEIFQDFRGRGTNPILINYVLFEHKREGLIRAFIETNLRNTSEIKSLTKTHFKKFGLARKFHIFGRPITIWSKATSTRTEFDEQEQVLK